MDIEAVDMVAEVARLEALGARRIAKLIIWVVLEAPSGHLFFVVVVFRGGFD